MDCIKYREPKREVSEGEYIYRNQKQYYHVTICRTMCHHPCITNLTRTQMGSSRNPVKVSRELK
jgi:hypothetical protein